MFLHFKSIKINEDIERINSSGSGDNKSPESIKANGDIAYDIIDIIAIFESYDSLVGDIFNSISIKSHLTKELQNELGNLRAATTKWKHVRNKIGGHVDIEPIKEFCNAHNYKGVFISNQLEADFKGILILRMIESAINSTIDKSKLFDQKIALTTPEGLSNLVQRINIDLSLCLNIFHSLSKFLYGIGKQEKLRSITAEDIGIIKF